MIDVKRIAYLLVLALLIGLLLVHLRTGHIQAACRLVGLSQQQQQLEQDLTRQQVLLSELIEQPRCLTERAAQMGLRLCPPGEKPEFFAQIEQHSKEIEVQSSGLTSDN